MMEEMFEKILSSEVVYHGVIFDVERHQIEQSTGRKARRDLVRNTDAVAVVAVDDAENVILVQQYRISAGRVMTEIPAGKLEIGEDPQAAALRELEEETGYAAGRVEKLMVFRGSVGFLCEKVYIYLVTGLKAGAAHPDEGEMVNVLRMPLSEAAERCASGEWEDGKTQAAILAARYRLNERKGHAED